ncbi:hypothetical protein [Acidianus bottle-shaped virus 2 strain ABV2]|uniref:Uncharacterized protein n=1 Tax=Acidianus bottle-shaped virus 2 strain ABV2 TaxID=1732173 RepID=A0A0N9P6Y7_9VIRU|nr:hypothetical protein AVU01_gp23 [Acidianus bottle-shaped virus 2 strain ABV2]ALG96771.1 hypothetical protein [Acidianus bottle-shaped virus 2 strain ABV2]
MANFVGLSDVVGQLLKAMIKITFDIIFTLSKYVARGFTHWILDTFRYLNDMVSWLTRLMKR